MRPEDLILYQMILTPVQNVDESNPIWMLAKFLSSKGEHYFKLGAVIVKRGNILGFGYNSLKTHPKFGSKQDYRTLHSEGAALYGAHKLRNDVSGADIYIYRKNNRTSKPCSCCYKMLKKAGIKNVIYTQSEK